MKNKILKALLITVLLEFLILGFFSFKTKDNYEYQIQEINLDNQAQPTQTNTDDQPAKASIKSSTPWMSYLDVPFVCQAPLQTEKNWELHEESCEEAAVLQAYLYETNTTISREEANTEILKMIDWEVENFGAHKDLYADDLKKFINGYYQIPLENIEIIYDATLENIREEISQKHPVIVPIMGDVLKNPYYPYPGYHMLVVTGYTQDKIITNDNGTRRGEDFAYDKNIFMKAMTAAGGDIVIIKN